MSDDHRPVMRITAGGMPAASAALAPPMRSECAPKRAGSSPILAMSAFTIFAMESREKAMPSDTRKSGVRCSWSLGTGSSSIIFLSSRTRSR
eukprot:5914895-Prymnesium_polylepis.2